MTDSTWTCYHCGEPAEEGASSCPACGDSFVEICAGCSAPRSRLLRGCPECGRPIQRRRPVRRRLRFIRQNRKRLLVLAGLLGVILLVSNVLISIPKPRGEKIATGIGKGRTAIRAGDPREAIIHLESVLKLDGRNTEALELLALALEQIGESSVALERAREAVAIDSGCGVAQIIIARSLIRRGRYEEARERSNLALKEIDAGARYLLGTIARSVGDLPLAIEQLRRVPEGDPYRAQALLDLGDIYSSHPSGAHRTEATAAYEAAMRICEKRLILRPDGVAILAQTARAEEGLERYDDAVLRLQRIAGQHSDERRVMRARTEARLRIIRIFADRIQELEEATREALSLVDEEGDPRAYIALARVYRLQGDAPRARSTLNEGIDANRGDASLRATLVHDLIGAGELEEARRKATTAMAQTDRHPEVCVALARVFEALAEREEDEEARGALMREVAAAYAVALERDAQNVKLRRRLVEILLPGIVASGDPDAAIEATDELDQAALDSVDWVLRLRPTDPQASYWRGRIRLRAAGEDQETVRAAAADLELAAREFPRDMEVLRWLGYAQNRAAEPLRAAGAYQAAIRALPSDAGPAAARLYVLFATACLEGGRLEKREGEPIGPGYVGGALGACRTALERWPDCEERLALLRIQAQALLRIRRPREALAATRAARETDPEDVPTMLLHGAALEAVGQSENAEGILFEAVAREPGRRARTVLAEFLGRQGRREEAEEQFQALFAASPGSVEVLVAFGDFLLRNGDRDRALEEYRKAATRAPSSVLPLVRLADTMLTGAVEAEQGEVRLLLRRAKEIAPDDPDVMAMDGRLLLMDEKPEEAAKLLERVVAVRPRNAAALYYLGLARFDLRDFQEARRRLERSLMFDPGLTPAKLLLARIELAEGYALYRQHRSEAAKAQLERALALNPDLPAARVLLADTYLDLGQQDLSRVEITKFLASIPEDRVADRAAAYFLLGFASLHDAKRESDPEASEALFDEAIRAFLNVVGQDPANWRGHYQLGLAYERKGATENALRSYDQARRNAPGEPTVVFAIVRLLVESGDSARAMTLLRLESDTHQQTAEFPHLIGDLLRQTGDVDAALDAYAQARARDPEDVEAVLTPARLLLKRGRSDAARSLVRDWIPRVKASRGPLYRWLGEVALQRGDLESAVQDLRQALATGEKDPATALGLARAYQRKGKLDQAVKAYRTALDMGLEDLDVLRQLADLLLETGQSGDAIGRYETILEKRPDDLEALNNLAVALADEKQNLDRALECATRVHDAMPDAHAVQDTLGWVLLRRGEPERGLALLQTALRHAPADPTIRFHEAMAFRAIGQEEKALKGLRSLLMNPKLSGALQARIRRELRGR